jgi:hypothetical protein
MPGSKMVKFGLVGVIMFHDNPVTTKYASYSDGFELGSQKFFPRQQQDGEAAVGHGLCGPVDHYCRNSLQSWESDSAFDLANFAVPPHMRVNGLMYKWAECTTHGNGSFRRQLRHTLQ